VAGGIFSLARKTMCVYAASFGLVRANTVPASLDHTFGSIASFDCRPATSDVPRGADIRRVRRHVSWVPKH
jgi:hypothetical protein